jgi:hypothetical protein
MSTIIANEKTTLYLNPRVKKSVQHFALHQKRSLSDIVNMQLEEYLEDIECVHDLVAKKDNARFRPWGEVKEQLKKDGLL